MVETTNRVMREGGIVIDPAFFGGFPVEPREEVPKPVRIITRDSIIADDLSHVRRTTVATVIRDQKELS